MQTSGRSADPRHPGVHFPPPLLFVAALAGGVLLDRWIPFRVLPDRSRAIGVLAGWLLVGVWAVISGWSLGIFARERTAIMPNRPARRLVTFGPYCASRNPMYLALVGLHVGVSILVNTAWPIVFLPPVILVLHGWIVPREERYLQATFREEYDKYRSRVRRWL